MPNPPTSSERTTFSTTVLDVLLKYSVALAAVVYGIGCTVNIAYVSKMGTGISDISLADPAFVARGALLGAFVVVGALIAVVTYFLLNHPRMLGGAHTSASLRLSVLWAPTAVVLVYWVFELFELRRKFGAAYTDALWIAVPAAASTLILVWMVLAPRIFLEADTLQQVAILTILALCLYNYASRWGRMEWRYVTDGAGTVRLLVAPDAVAGAKQMGLSFTQKNMADSMAQLSDPIVLVYSGGRTYFVRLGSGQIVQLQKDKVWGVTH